MAQIRIDIASENSASREILRLRGEINNLGEQIARNNARTASGTAAERAKTAETNRGIRAHNMQLATRAAKSASDCTRGLAARIGVACERAPSN